MKGEKHMIDNIDDKMMQCISAGDRVDHIDDVDNNVNHADTQKNKKFVINQSWEN